MFVTLSSGAQKMNPVIDQTNLTVQHNGQVILVNKFTPKPGKLDEFVSTQIGEYKSLTGKVKGFISNQLLKSVDGKFAVNVAIFEDLETYNSWRTSKLFADHLDVIKHLIEKSEPGMYEVVYDSHLKK